VIKFKYEDKEKMAKRRKGIYEDDGVTIMNIKRKQKKLSYAAGGIPLEEEAKAPIPLITCSSYYEPLDLLILCFIDGQCKLFTLHA